MFLLGWAPSTFVSSRSDRAKQKAARPEDFMDEEDLAELRDSKKLVDENEEMDFGGTASELKKRNNDLDEQEECVLREFEVESVPCCLTSYL